MREEKRRGTALGMGGQMMAEYAIIFTVVVAVIVWSAITLFRPAVNRFFNASSNCIDTATATVRSSF